MTQIDKKPAPVHADEFRATPNSLSQEHTVFREGLIRIFCQSFPDPALVNQRAGRHVAEPQALVELRSTGSDAGQ